MVRMMLTMTSRTIRHLSLGAAAATMALIVSVVIESPQARAVGTAPAVTPVGTVAPSIAGLVSVFDQPATPGDIPTSATVTMSGLEGLASVGYAPAAAANPALAKLALVTPQGASIYVVPTAGGVCVLDSSGVVTATCATTDQITAGEALAGTTCSPSLPNGQIEVAGVVPTGAQNPIVTLSNGTTQPLSVKNNVFVIRTAQLAPLPTTIQWATANGTKVSASVPLPADTATQQCDTTVPSSGPSGPATS
jgi:hypothetical protein